MEAALRGGVRQEGILELTPPRPYVLLKLLLVVLQHRTFFIPLPLHHFPFPFYR